MVENRNIYKMDDILIILSYVMLVPVIFFAWPWLKTAQEFTNLGEFFSSAPAVLGSRLSAVAMYGSAAVCSQLVGRIIRFKENQSLKIIDALGYSGRIPVSQLSSQLNMSESRVRSLVGKMAKMPALNIVLEGDMVSVGRKQQTPSSQTAAYQREYVQPASPGTPAAEAPVSQPDEATETGTAAGGAARSKEDIEREIKEMMQDKTIPMQEKLQRLRAYGSEHPELKKVPGMTKTPGVPGTQEGEKPKKFHLILFIFLFITPLWPIAIIYAISYAVKQRKALMGEVSGHTNQ